MQQTMLTSGPWVFDHNSVLPTCFRLLFVSYSVHGHCKRSSSFCLSIMMVSLCQIYLLPFVVYFGRNLYVLMVGFNIRLIGTSHFV